MQHAWLICLAAGVAIPIFGNGRLLAIHLVFGLLFPAILALVVKTRELRILWAVTTIWGIAQLISDLIYGQPIPSAVLLAGPTIALLASGLFWAHKELNIDKARCLSAVGVGWIAIEVIAGEAFATGNPWKFGFATPVIVTVLALAYNGGAGRRTLLLLILSLAGVSFALDSRTQTALLLIAAVIVATSGVKEALEKSRKMLIVLLLTATASYVAYPVVAVTGALGDRAQAQQIAYNQDGSNFLLANRMEMPQLAFLAVRNLGLGIGSNAPVSGDEANAALEFLDRNIAPLTSAQTAYLVNAAAGSPGYNTHSQALSTVLFAGFLAIPFWVYLGSLFWRGAKRLSSGADAMPALLVYLGGSAAWDALFSPMATRSHIAIAVTVFLFVAVLNVARERESEVALGRQIGTRRV